MALTAKYPPMGWNSFDAYSWCVTEEELLKNAEFVDKNLKQFGYDYIVLDFIWAEPGRNDNANPHQDADYNPTLFMDRFGRLLPSPDRFPSSVGNAGLKPIADIIHGMGMKFGLHLMRGIPRQAAAMKAPIKGTNYTADQIVITDEDKNCSWLNHMYGLDMSKPGAQEYLNSIFELYAQWEVDFVKVDDMVFPYYCKEELEGYRKAIDGCGRSMVLSLSPGEAPPSQAEHLGAHADMWRISADFWDNWEALKKLNRLFDTWSKSGVKNGFPDGDMVPFSKLSLTGPMGKPRYSLFTHDEKLLLMTLWTINNSPLMLGGDLTVIDDDALKILTNPDVLAACKFAKDARKVSDDGEIGVWQAGNQCSDRITYLAALNLSDDMKVVDLDISAMAGAETYLIQDLWEGTRENASGARTVCIRPHGAVYYMVIKK